MYLRYDVFDRTKNVVEFAKFLLNGKIFSVLDVDID
jgi:hypothetical protein